MLGAKRAGLLHRLVNDKKLPSVLARMPVGDWKQWARERPTWIGGPVEDAFWTFIDQKRKDSLNVEAAEPAGWDQGGTFNRWPGIVKKEEQDKPGIKKIPSAGIHVAVATGGPSDLWPASKEV
jgi:hypothetical protein